MSLSGEEVEASPYQWRPKGTGAVRGARNPSAKWTCSKWQALRMVVAIARLPAARYSCLDKVSRSMLLQSPLVCCTVLVLFHGAPNPGGPGAQAL